jgi:phosphoglycerate kinase
MSWKNLSDLPITGRTVFFRLDLNVPLGPQDEEGIRVIEDASRIEKSLPSIRYALEQDAKIVIASHLGKPEKRDAQWSMQPVARKMAELLSQDITLVEDCGGESTQLMIQGLKRKEILLLENLRFYPQEKANHPDFAKNLARLAQVYVFDAFATAHRKHASTYGMIPFMHEKALGFLAQTELKYLNLLLNQPKKPFIAILGGSKVADKIKLIQSLLKRVQGLLIGGAMAHAFWAAQKRTLPEGTPLPRTQEVQAAETILTQAQRLQIPLLIPEDSLEGFDIGPRTLIQFQSVIEKASTLFWNGPLGKFEDPRYASGTLEIARCISETPALRIAGGGDTLSAIAQAQLTTPFDHLSTAGGAALAYLQEGTLPALEALEI